MQDGANADGRWVLALFESAAARTGTLPVEEFLAAQKAAPTIGTLPSPEVRASVEAMLCAPHPEAVGALVSAQGLAAFGLYETRACVHALQKAPCVPAARWAMLIELCGANAQAVMQALWMPEAQAREVAGFLAMEHAPKLSVSWQQLHAEGIRGRRLERVWNDLQKAVAHCPALNTFDTLDEVAHAFAELH